MFNLFKKKKYLPIADYPESWAIIQEKINPKIIRVNLGYKDAIRHPDYPIKMGIAIPVEIHDEIIMEVKSEVENILTETLLKKEMVRLSLLSVASMRQNLSNFCLIQKKVESTLLKFTQT